MLRMVRAALSGKVSVERSMLRAEKKKVIAFGTMGGRQNHAKLAVCAK